MFCLGIWKGVRGFDYLAGEFYARRCFEGRGGEESGMLIFLD